MENKYSAVLEEIMGNDVLKEIKQRTAEYGIASKIIQYQVDEDKADSGYYIIAGFPDYPDYDNPMELVNDINRNENLFYIKKFAFKLDENNIQFGIEDLFAYCQKAELLQCLYKEYDCEIPDVIRFEEYYTIENFNKDWNNPDLDLFARRECKNAIDKFFDSEKKAEKKKATYRWKQFYRSDLYDSRKPKKHFWIATPFNSKDQIIPLSTLNDCCRNVVTFELQEFEYQQLKEVLKKYPKIYYSIDEKVVVDHGKILGNDPWENEQSYFEFRNIHFKKVDEPVIMGEIYNLKFKEYACNRMQLPGGNLTSRNVSFRYAAAFAEEAKKRGLNFAIDMKGIYSKATTESLPVLFAPNQLYKFDSIMNDINYFHFNNHTYEESNLPYLADVLKDAEERARKNNKAIPLNPSRQNIER